MFLLLVLAIFLRQNNKFDRKIQNYDESDVSCEEKQDGAIDLPTTTNGESKKIFYGCNKELKEKVFSNNCLLYLYSCRFQSIVTTENKGGAIFIIIPMSGSISGSLLDINNCLFDSCESPTGGAIYCTINANPKIIKITNCKFQNNKAEAQGGGIYFFGFNGTIGNCTFINNIVKDNTGDDFYYNSKDKNGKKECPFIIEYCRFERSTETARPIIYLANQRGSDFCFYYNTILISADSKSFLFNPSPLDVSEFDMKSNLISDKQSICESSGAGFCSEIAAFFEKTDEKFGPDSGSSSCPPKPENSHDIKKDFSHPENTILYACDFESKFQVNAMFCLVRLYNCVFHSIGSERTDGGAISLLTNANQTPEGNCIIDNCTFDECIGLSGGAITISAQKSTRFIQISNCTFTNNHAKSDGGAVHFLATFATISNCTFLDNIADSRGCIIYFEVNEEFDTENPLIFEHCKFTQNKGNNEMIFFQWNDKSDFYFNYNEVKIDPNSKLVLFSSTGAVNTGNLSCQVNCLLPSNDFLCNKENKALYERIKIGFQNECPPRPDFIFDDNKCPIDKGCHNSNKEESYEHVVVTQTTFNKCVHEDNGGAIYLFNTGITFNDATISNCESKTAGGGGIYIYNDLDMYNHASLSKLKIDSCKAAFGAGLYMYIKSVSNIVSIKGCSFNDNTVYEQVSNSNVFFGGSGVYLTVAKGVMTECSFNNNHGPGGVIKITDNFDEKPKNNGNDLRILNTKQIKRSIQKSFTISGCKFIIEKSSHCSLFYVQGKESIKTEVKNCSFIGQLAKNSYHIDAQMARNDKSSLLIDNCMFSSNSKQAFNNKLIKADLSKQVFNYKNKESLLYSTKLWFAVASFGVVFCAVMTAFIVNKKNNEISDNEKTEETHEILTISLDNESKL